MCTLSLISSKIGECAPGQSKRKFYSFFLSFSLHLIICCPYTLCLFLKMQYRSIEVKLKSILDKNGKSIWFMRYSKMNRVSVTL